MSKNTRQPPRHLAAAEKGIRGRRKGTLHYLLKVYGNCPLQLSSRLNAGGGGVEEGGRWSFLLQKLNEKKKQERKDTAAPRLVEENVYCR